MQLHRSAAAGDLEDISRRFRAGETVDALDDEGSAPLHRAAESRHADVRMIDLLLKAGADPNGVSTHRVPKAVAEATARFGGEAAIDDLLAHAGMSASLIEQLRKIRAEAAIHGPLTKAPLELAAQSGDVAKVKRLIEAGAVVRYVDSNGYAAITAAANCRWPTRIEMVRTLLAAGADPNVKSSYGESPLSVASRWGDYDIVRFLVKSGADPAVMNWTALMRAIVLGGVADVEAELRAGADLTARDFWSRTPLLLAVHVGEILKAKAILSAGGKFEDRSRGGGTAMMDAADRDNVAMLTWLIERGADLNAATEFGKTALMHASEAGAVGCVQTLLAAGTDPRRQDHTQHSALSVAASAEIVSLLVAVGEDINYIDGAGYNLLRSAAERGDAEMTRELLRMGAAVDASSTGETALQWAVVMEEREVVRALLDGGADPKQADIDGMTPLFRARSPSVARMLLEAGADPGALNMFGEAAAERQKDPEIVELLAEWKHRPKR
jgi:ankyrin repeat protein